MTSVGRHLVEHSFQDLPLSKSWYFLFFLKVLFSVLSCCSLREELSWQMSPGTFLLNPVAPFLWEPLCCFSVAWRMLKSVCGGGLFGFFFLIGALELKSLIH